MALTIFDSYGVITTFILSYLELAFVMLLTFRLLRPLGLFVPNKASFTSHREGES